MATRLRRLTGMTAVGSGLVHLLLVERVSPLSPVGPPKAAMGKSSTQDLPVEPFVMSGLILKFPELHESYSESRDSLRRKLGRLPLRWVIFLSVSRNPGLGRMGSQCSPHYRLDYFRLTAWAVGFLLSRCSRPHRRSSANKCMPQPFILADAF